jgi:hypothetical protein
MVRHSISELGTDQRPSDRQTGLRVGFQTAPTREASDMVSMDPCRHMYRAWCSFRCRYSGYRMAEEKDVLIALNGVAQDVADVMNDQLVAGLWKSRLIEDMCWAHHDFDPCGFLDPCRQPCRPSKWRAPTWGWASICHSVRPSDSRHRIMTDRATLVSLFVSQKFSGELVQASMQLSCRLLPVQWRAWLHRWFSIKQQLDVPYSLWVTLDDHCGSNKQRIKDLSSIYGIVLRTADPFRFSGGIIVAPHAYKHNCFERIGYFCQDRDMDFSDFVCLEEGYRKAQEVVIELV